MNINDFFLFFFCALKSIQRRLEEIEVNFKELEDKGVVLERTLRGEAGKKSKCRHYKLIYID